MYWHVLGRGIVSLALIFGFSTAIVGGHSFQQSPDYNNGSTDERVLDIIFPRDEGDFRDGNSTKEFSIVLRFKPSFDAESQVNIIKHVDGRIEVITYRPSNNKNVHYQLIELRKQTGREDADFLAKMIPVEKRIIKKRSRFFIRLLDRFAALRFSPRFDTGLYLDPTTYDLWYEAISSKAHFSLAGPDSGKAHYNSPIIRWMNEVLNAVK